MGKYTAKPRRWRSALACLALTTAIAGTPIAAGGAQADQMTVISCHTPDGAAAGDAGWTIKRSSDNFMYASANCSAGGQGAMILEVAANPAGYTSASEIDWVDEAPAWATIAKYTLLVAGNYSAGGNAEYQIGMGQTYIATSNELAQGVFDLRDLGNGQWSASSIDKAPSEPTRVLRINASCDGEWGRCSANVPIAWIDLTSAAIVLNDPTYPSVSGISGSLLSAEPLQGEAEAIFTATDKGPGVYSAWIEVDGHAQQAVQLDSNNGACTNLGQTTNGTRSFTSPDPCAETISGAVSLDTAVLHDGKHTVKLLVDDASGNSTLAYTGTIETHNAPTVLSAPSISGSASVGGTLSANPGSFSAPEGAGSLSAITGQWLRCTDAAATHCTAIAGATASTYSPTSNDAGYYLIDQDTISDNDGITTSDSQPTIAVSEPPSNVAGDGGQSNPGGAGGAGATAGPGGAGGTGGAGASGSAGAGGSAGTGPLTVNLTNPGLLGSNSPWQISLQLSAHKLSKGKTLRFSGAVSAEHQAVDDKLVLLRARWVAIKRTGKRHHHKQQTIYGKWKTFADLYTAPNGSFHATHTFLFRGPQTYQFQAIATQESGYLNTTGYSPLKTVLETATKPNRHAASRGRRG